jgi:hypothetical protein
VEVLAPRMVSLMVGQVVSLQTFKEALLTKSRLQTIRMMSCW